MLLTVLDTQCRACGTFAAHPVLPGEYWYGEFILYAEQGNGHLYLNVIEDGAGVKVWDFVHSILGDDSLAVEVTANLCDPNDGSLHFLQMRCPACGGRDLSFPSNEAAPSKVDLPRATFNTFWEGTTEFRVARVKAILRQVREIEKIQQAENKNMYRVAQARPPSWLENGSESRR